MEKKWKRKHREVVREYLGYQNMNLVMFRVKWFEFKLIQEVNVMYQGTIQQYIQRLHEELGAQILREWVNEVDGKTHVEMYKPLFLYAPLLFVAEARLIKSGDKILGKISLRCRPRYNIKLVNEITAINDIV